MPNIHLQPFFLDDLTLAWIDRVRGDRMRRQEFFERMIQYGLANAFEEVARLSRDYATQDTANKTASFLKGRDLLSVVAAKGAETARPGPDAYHLS